MGPRLPDVPEDVPDAEEFGRVDDHVRWLDEQALADLAGQTDLADRLRQVRGAAGPPESDPPASSGGLGSACAPGRDPNRVSVAVVGRAPDEIARWLASASRLAVSGSYRSADDLPDGATAADPLSLFDVVVLDAGTFPGAAETDVGAGIHPAAGTEEQVRRLVAAGLPVVVLGEQIAAGTVRASIRAGALGFVPNRSLELVASVCAEAAAGRPSMTSQLAFLLFTDDAPDRPALSAREREVLRLRGAGMPLALVARRMRISVATVRQHLHRILSKYRRPGPPPAASTVALASAPAPKDPGSTFGAAAGAPPEDT